MVERCGVAAEVVRSIDRNRLWMRCDGRLSILQSCESLDGARRKAEERKKARATPSSRKEAERQPKPRKSEQNTRSRHFLILAHSYKLRLEIDVFHVQIQSNVYANSFKTPLKLLTPYAQNADYNSYSILTHVVGLLLVVIIVGKYRKCTQ